MWNKAAENWDVSCGRKRYQGKSNEVSKTPLLLFSHFGKQFGSILNWDPPPKSGTPLQYCCPENPMDGGAWEAAVHGVAKSWTRLSDFTFTFHFHALEKEMATHSSVLAWRIP